MILPLKKWRESLTSYSLHSEKTECKFAPLGFATLQKQSLHFILFLKKALSKKSVTILLLPPLSLFAGEYDFDVESFEKKAFESKGYIQFAPLYTKEKSTSYASNQELNYEFSYKKSTVNANINYSLHQSLYSNQKNTKQGVLNEAYQTFGENTSLLVGKKALKWGKGYVYNPVAFLDRKKDPLDPESLKEGYVLGEFKLIRTLDKKALKNYSLSLVYMPSNFSVNHDYDHEIKHSHGAKLYLLLYDIDIDLIAVINDNRTYFYGRYVTQSHHGNGNSRGVCYQRRDQ